MLHSTAKETPGPPRVAKSRAMTGCAVSLLVIGLLFVVQLALQTDPQETRALKITGSIIRITAGSRPLILGSYWQKVALGIDRNLGSRVGGYVLDSPAAVPDALVIWKNQRRSPIFFWSGPAPMVEVVCSDEQGQTTREFVTAGGSTAGSPFLNAGENVISPFVLVHYPRRGRTVRIETKDAAGQALGESWVVANPAPGPHPVWKVEAPTPPVRSGALVVVAQDYTPGVKVTTDFEHLEDRLRLVVRDPGGGASDWTVEALEIRDATGNKWTLPAESLETTATTRELHISTASLSPPDEEVLKVRVTLGRVGNLPREETGVLQNLPLPPRGVLRKVRRAVEIQGRTVEVSYEIGDGASHNLGWVGSGTELALWARNRPADRVIRIRWPGQRVWQSPDFRANQGCYCVSVPDFIRGKQSSLEVALTRTRTVEFLVQPRRPRN